MALPPSPPRITGDPARDVVLIANWANDFFKAAVLEGAFLQTAVQLAASSFDPASLPDPASTTLARAQLTANQAYTLAALANTTASSALTNANTAVSKSGTAGQATIGSTVTTGTFTFATAQADASYFATATVSAITGTPGSSSMRVTGLTKSTASVIVTVADAPGAGASITFDIQIQRTS